MVMVMVILRAYYTSGGGGGRAYCTSGGGGGGYTECTNLLVAQAVGVHYPESHHPQSVWLH